MSDPAAIHRTMAKLKLIVGKGRLGPVVDSGDVQRVQGIFLGGAEVHDNMVRAQDYGVTSNPPGGLPLLAVFPAGDRAAGYVIAAMDNSFRIVCQTGEVAVYDDLGQKVHLTRTGIAVTTPFDLTADVGGNSTYVTAGTHRVQAARIELHATEYFRFDVAGHGQFWYPTRVDSWTIGAEAGIPHPITEPEIG